MTTLQLIPLRMLNGTLILGYLALDHLRLLLLCPALIWPGAGAPPEQRPFTLAQPWL